MTTKTLPTDKHGQIYRGPRTWKQVEAISEAIFDNADQRWQARIECRRLRDMLTEHGYTGLARRLTTTYDLE